MSLILYGTEDFTLNEAELSSLDFVINSLSTNLFKTNSIDAIQFFFNIIMILKNSMCARRVYKFDIKFATSDNAFYKLTFSL